METITIDVKGMTCQHCVQTVKGALEQIKGVKNVEVALETGKVNLVYDPGLAEPSQFKAAVVEAGYEVS